MKINKYRFAKIVPDDELKKVGFIYKTDAIRITGHTWCKPMTNRGLCTKKCENCQAAILASMKDVNPQTVKSVEAVYIYRLRQQLSRTVEAAAEKEKSTPVAGDIWDALGETL